MRKMLLLCTILALLLSLTSCIDPTLMDLEGTPGMTGSAPAMEATPAATPEPAIEPTMSPTPEPENQWESEKSVYEIMSENMYGWGTVAVKSNGKIYYVADDYKINVIDESGNTSELIDLKDTLTYPIYQLYITDECQIYFTTNIPGPGERVCIAAVYKIENNKAEIIYRNEDHIDFVGAYGNSIYMYNRLREILSIYNLQSGLETEYEFSYDEIIIEIYFDAGIGCLYMLFYNENQVHLMTFDMETESIIADCNIGTYLYEDLFEEYGLVDGTLYEYRMSFILSAEIEDETASVKMINLSDGGVIGEFSISFDTWIGLYGYYAYEDRILLFCLDRNINGMGIYEYSFADNIMTDYYPLPSFGWPFILDGKAFISNGYDLFYCNLSTNNRFKLFSIEEFEFFGYTIVDNYFFISSYVGPQDGFDYPLLEEILTVDSAGESEILWSRAE